MMHKMQWELNAEGHDVEFLAVNITSGVEAAPTLVEKCAFPLLQDTEDINVWNLLGGKKDDIYVFDADGNLTASLPVGGELSNNLSTAEGYGNLKAAIMEAMP
jgi:hypothetical protein